MRVDGTVKVGVRHVIDRGDAQSARHLDPVLVLEGSPTKDCVKEQRKSACGTVVTRKGMNGKKIVVQDAQS